MVVLGAIDLGKAIANVELMVARDGDLYTREYSCESEEFRACELLTQHSVVPEISIAMITRFNSESIFHHSHSPSQLLVANVNAWERGQD
jgi:hypothetical protein